MIDEEAVDSAINKTTHSIILSKQNRDRRKWENFEDNERTVNMNAIIISELKDEYMFIGLRIFHFWFTRPVLYNLSYQVCGQFTREEIWSIQGNCFIINYKLIWYLIYLKHEKLMCLYTTYNYSKGYPLYQLQWYALF